MKCLYYSPDNVFKLTDVEFEAARHSFENKKSYYCYRLGADLSPYYKFATTPKGELNREIFIEEVITQGKSFKRRLFRQEDQWYELIDNEGSTMKTALYRSPENLVPQEEYYNSSRGGMFTLSPEQISGSYMADKDNPRLPGKNG